MALRSIPTGATRASARPSGSSPIIARMESRSLLATAVSSFSLMVERSLPALVSAVAVSLKTPLRSLRLPLSETAASESDATVSSKFFEISVLEVAMPEMVDWS